MHAEEPLGVRRAGVAMGYTLSYFLFTTILFIMLILLKKIPASWTYFHVMGITGAIALAGIAVKRLLK